MQQKLGPLLEKYQACDPIVPTCSIDLKSLDGKSVVITGAARGLGKAYAEAFVNAGAFVTIGDVDLEAVTILATQLGEAAAVPVRCDVREWRDQVSLFEKAIASSPGKNVDIVIANAGLGGAGDAMMIEDDPDQTPTEPDLKTIDVNVKGVLYTTRLALHYFRRFQQRDGASDRCLILKSSMAGFVDWEKSLQYPTSKAGVRTLMKCLRRIVWKDGIRVNVVAPAFVDTGIIPQPFKLKLMAAGMEFADVEDAVKAILRICCDPSINGRSLGVVPRSSMTPEGYVDLASDDLKENDFLYPYEQMALNMKV